MPEGDTVRTWAQRLDSAIGDRRLTRFELRRGARDRLPPSPAARSVARLGPDLSTVALDFDAATARMAALPPHTEIGDVLLDERAVAGIGNVFASEVCWACRVHPATSIGALDRSTWRTLLETAHRQLRMNVGRSRRVTFGNGLAVYGRAGAPCPRCSTPIAVARRGRYARVTYWCPECQLAR